MASQDSLCRWRLIQRINSEIRIPVIHDANKGCKMQLLSITSNLHLSNLTRPFSLTYRFILIAIRITLLLQYSYIILYCNFFINITLVIIFYTQYGSNGSRAGYIFSLARKKELFDQLNICGENILQFTNYFEIVESN